MVLSSGKNRIVVGAAFLCLLLLAGLWYWFFGSLATVATEARFVSSEGEIVARFEGGVAIVTGLGLEAVKLSEVETAAGARYEDRVSGITLWHKGEEVTLYQNGVIVFTGVDTPIDSLSSTEARSSTEEQLLGVRWVWKETLMSDGTKVIPSTAEVFTVTFTGGRVVGTTDCNNFNGAFTLSNASLSAGPFMSTKMYCAASSEQEFMSVLEGQTTVLFNIEGDLVLLLPEDAGSVFFTQATSSEVSS